MKLKNSIILPDDGQCAFCDYLTGSRPYTILSRNNLSAIFVTREQRGIPHLLVVPIQHRTTVLDLSNDEAADVALQIRSAARAIDAAYARPGISVWQNNGVSSNQAISHVHFHVAGTLDDGGTAWGEVRELEISQTDLIANRLLAHFDFWRGELKK